MRSWPEDFAVIKNYKEIIRNSKEPFDESPDTVACNDQEVPNSTIAFMQDSFKSVVKKEPPHEQDFCLLGLADVLEKNFIFNSDTTTDYHDSFNDLRKSPFDIPQSEHFLSNSKEFSQSSRANTAISTTGMCPLEPSNISNVLSQSQSSPFSCTSSSFVKTGMTTKTKTFVTGLAGSGCTVTTNSSHVLLDSNPDLFQNQFKDEFFEYIDLDKQVYDDMDSNKDPMISCTRRPVPQQGGNESEILEDTILQCVQDTIHQDSNYLNIPFDPQSWTCEHVCRWVDWVCNKNRLPNISKHLIAVNGQTLCLWNEDYFSSQLGSTGNWLFNELDLWKAAVNSCYSQQGKQALEPISCQTVSMPQNNFLGKRDSIALTPSSSPAPSSCGSSSPNSSNDVLSQQSDMIDDDSIFCPDHDVKPSTNKLYKRVPGRGHKKSLALWQFLRKLLLSDQNYGCIRWTDRKAGIFKIEDSKRVATLWGIEKNRPAMNYDKLSRSVRQYYKKGIIKKPEQSKRLLYQFCPEYL